MSAIGINYELVKQLRKDLGLTQKDLAQKANVSLSVIQKIETGGKNQPSIATVARIAFALNKKIDDLIIKEVGNGE